MSAVKRVSIAPWLPRIAKTSVPPPATPSWLAPPQRLSLHPAAPMYSQMPAPIAPQIIEMPPQAAVHEEPLPAPAFIPRMEPPPPAPPQGLLEEIAMLQAQVADLTSANEQLRREVLEQSEGELVQLAIAIAERVVARELSISPDLVVHWAREAIDAIAPKEDAVIVVGTSVSQRVPTEGWDSGISFPHRVEVSGSMDPDGCEVRAGASTVDVSASGRFAAVTQALTGERR